MNPDWGRVLAARDRLVAAARQTGPEADTLCEGWQVHDLVAHLLTLQRDPLSWPGMGLGFLSSLTERRMEAALRNGYSAALGRLAHRPPGIPIFLEDPWRGYGHHLGEYAVHTEDIVRANGLPPTELDPATDDALWRRLLPAAATLLARRGFGLRLRRADGPESTQVLPGEVCVVATGTALELLMLCYRGPHAADVRLTGPKKAAEALWPTRTQ